MIFRKSERRNGLSGLYLVVGTLALIGALGITSKGKKCICTVKRKMREWMTPQEDCDESC